MTRQEFEEKLGRTISDYVTRQLNLFIHLPFNKR